MKKCWMRSIVLLVLVSLVNPAAGAEPGEKPSANWPQFLGPHRNGISTETGLIDAWPDGGPKQVWQAEAGVGMSGLAVSDGRLITLWQTGGKQRVGAFDAKAGKPLWQTEIAPEYRNSMGDGPRATPAIVGDRAYIFTGEGILAAVDVTGGSIVWRHNVLGELGGKTADYGMACSPLVVADLVIVTAGASGGTVVAYHRQNGELAWKSGSDKAGYSSPALLEVGGRRQVVAVTGGSALGLTPRTGQVLWRFPYVTDFECNIATPLAYQGQVFISSGENHGCALLGLKASGDRFDVEPVWTSYGPKSVLRNEWQTSVLLDGHLYGLDNVGSAGPVTHLTCVEIATGQRRWQQLRFGKANLIAADGKLLLVTMKGELVLVRATPESYQEIGRGQVIGTTRQAPALAGGLLYLRDDQHITCLDLK